MGPNNEEFGDTFQSILDKIKKLASPTQSEKDDSEHENNIRESFKKTSQSKTYHKSKAMSKVDSIIKDCLKTGRVETAWSLFKNQSSEINLNPEETKVFAKHIADLNNSFESFVSYCINRGLIECH